MRGSRSGAGAIAWTVLALAACSRDAGSGPGAAPLETPAASRGDAGAPPWREPAGAEPGAGSAPALSGTGEDAPAAASGALRLPQLAEQAERLEPGLELTFERLAPRAGALDVDVRRARLPALHVPRDEPATPFLGSGPFRATWRGLLDVPRRDDWVFSVAGRGSFELEIDGAVVLSSGGTAEAPPVRLKRGRVPFVLRYRSPLAGAAMVRVAWRCRQFGDEPIPPEAFVHDAAAVALRAGALVRAGRELVAERHCVRCHAEPVPAAADPVLSAAVAAPSLAGVGDRLDGAWLRAWLVDPRALRADARMPRMLQGDAAAVAQQAADIAAFLATCRVAAAAGAATGADSEVGDGEGDAARGAERAATLGCIACHGFTGPELAGDPGLVSLAHAGRKFRRGGLAGFLRAPQAHDPLRRMPDFGLDASDARDLAAWVATRGDAALPAADGPAGVDVAGDAVRGRELVARLGCAACHEVPGVDDAASAPPLAQVLASERSGGCLDRAATAPGVPDFGWSDEEVRALRAFATVRGESLWRESSIEAAERLVASHRCAACHVFDGRTSRWTEREPLLPVPAPAAGGEHGEAVTLSQNRPALTWAGEKLRTAWLRSFLAGETPSPRPWLHARMPRFSAIADVLARGLSSQHGYGTEDEADVAHDAERVATGRRLIAQQGGFGCVTCHAVGDTEPIALFEVQGIDFREVRARLRYDWYRRWMADPPRLEPAAKMPRYADADGRTAFGDVYGGDAARQFDAIWCFLHHAVELR